MKSKTKAPKINNRHFSGTDFESESFSTFDYLVMKGQDLKARKEAEKKNSAIDPEKQAYKEYLQRVKDKLAPKKVEKAPSFEKEQATEIITSKKVSKPSFTPDDGHSEKSVIGDQPTDTSNNFAERIQRLSQEILSTAGDLE